MTFNNLHVNTHCDCLQENCNEDTSSLYGIKTGKSNIREVDFKSKYRKAEEKGEPLGFTECDDICSYKGLSCSIVTEDTKAKIISIYDEIFHTSPKYRPFLNIIKWKEGAGVIKFTPLDNNPYHHDFYSCDGFAMEHVEVVETLQLGTDV